jgi:hypothetical protein
VPIARHFSNTMLSRMTIPLIGRQSSQKTENVSEVSRFSTSFGSIRVLRPERSGTVTAHIIGRQRTGFSGTIFGTALSASSPLNALMRVGFS